MAHASQSVKSRLFSSGAGSFLIRVNSGLFRWKYVSSSSPGAAMDIRAKRPLVGLQTVGGDLGDETNNIFFMATQKFKKSETEKSQTGSAGAATGSGKSKTVDSIWNKTTNFGWSPFLVISSKNERKLKTLNVFKIANALKDIIAGEAKHVSKLFSGDLLVELEKPEQSTALLQSPTFAGIPVKVEAHRTLNTSRGVVRSRDLEGCSEEDMVEEIEEVLQARRIILRRGEKTHTTNTFVLTFNAPVPPTTIKAGYLKLRVDPYVPNPLRCYKCQRFGHSQQKCSRSPVCARCGKGGHQDKDCNSDPKCPNCQGKHAAYSKECPTWLAEKQIQHHKAVHGGTFAQARAAVGTSSIIQGKSFSDVVKAKEPQPANSPKVNIQPLSNKTESPAKESPRKKGADPKKTNSQTNVETSNRFSALTVEEMDVVQAEPKQQSSASSCFTVSSNPSSSSQTIPSSSSSTPSSISSNLLSPSRQITSPLQLPLPPNLLLVLICLPPFQTPSSF